jgi:hypothetical protein
MEAPRATTASNGLASPEPALALAASNGARPKMKRLYTICPSTTASDSFHGCACDREATDRNGMTEWALIAARVVSIVDHFAVHRVQDQRS